MHAGPAHSHSPAKRRCKVSLTMIVRDEEDNLPDCLASADGLFDEIVVVDTGSTDRTVDDRPLVWGAGLRLRLGRRLRRRRNAALALATGDYAFWLDADDRIEPPQRERLRALLDGLRARRHGATSSAARATPTRKAGGATVVDHVRLFPVREDVRWTYGVHEQILPRCVAPGCRCAGPTSWSGTSATTTRPCGGEAAPRPGDPRGRARRATRRSVRPVQPRQRGDRGRRPALPLWATCSEPGGLGPVGLDRAEAARPDRAGAPDAGRDRGGTGGVRGRTGNRARRRRVLVPQGGAAPAPRRAREAHSLLAAGADTPPARAVLQRGRRDLRAPDPSKPGGSAEERGDRAEAALHWSAVLSECPGDTVATAALDRLAQPAGSGVRS